MPNMAAIGVFQLKAQRSVIHFSLAAEDHRLHTHVLDPLGNLCLLYVNAKKLLAFINHLQP